MFQRSNVAALSSPRGELGKYVNRLGWAVSSEEQRLAAIGRIKQYAQAEGLEDLEKLATGLEAATSLVFNPEGAIDAAVGADMKINLTATNSDLLMSFNLTRGAGFSEEVAQKSLGSALFSLLSEDESADLAVLAEKAGLKLTPGNAQEVVNTIFNRGDELSQELFGLINLTSENVGVALVKNTAKQIGAIRALQELYPEIDFSGIGMVGFDDFSTHLKLSGVLDDAGRGDVNSVLESILQGADEVSKATGKTLSRTGAIQKVRNLPLAGTEGADGKILSAEEIKLRLLDFFGLEGEAKANYGIFDPAELMEGVNKDLILFQKRMGRVSYNQYSPIQEFATAYNTTSLNEAMNELTGIVKSRLEDTAGDVGGSIENIIVKNNILRQIEDIKFSGRTLSKRSKLAGSLIDQGLATAGELEALRKTKSPALYEVLRKNIVQNLTASNDFAQQEARTSLQEFFTAHIQRYTSEPGKFNRPEDVMDKLLFEIEEMKNATRVSNSGMIQEVQRNLGIMLENALLSEEPIDIIIPGMKPFSLQELSAFVRTNNELRLTKAFAKTQTDDMVSLIQAVRDKSTDLNLIDQENLMDKNFLSKLFKVDKKSVTNAEIGILEGIPKLANPGEIQEILDNMTGSSIDIEFLEDFLAFGGDELEAEAIISQRIRSAATGKTEEEIAEEISNRIRLVGSVRRRYSALLEQAQPQYQQFNALLEGGEEVAEGVVTPGLRAGKAEESLGTIDEAIESTIRRFVRDAEDEADSAARAAIAATYTDPAAVATGKYTRIQDFMKSAKMQELYEGLLKNKGKVAGAAALATGLMVFGSIKKKEHTQEAISGPPLLPGGNPYERIPNSPMQLSDMQTAQGSQGESYNISINGDQDKIEEFMNRARISNKWKS